MTVHIFFPFWSKNLILILEISIWFLNSPKSHNSIYIWKNLKMFMIYHIIRNISCIVLLHWNNLIYIIVNKFEKLLIFFVYVRLSDHTFISRKHPSRRQSHEIFWKKDVLFSHNNQHENNKQIVQKILKICLYYIT